MYVKVKGVEDPETGEVFDGVRCDCDGCGDTIENSDGYSIYRDEAAVDEMVLNDPYSDSLTTETDDGETPRHFCRKCWTDADTDFPLGEVYYLAYARQDPTHCIEYMIDYDLRVAGTRVVTR